MLKQVQDSQQSWSWSFRFVVSIVYNLAEVYQNLLKVIVHMIIIDQ